MALPYIFKQITQHSKFSATRPSSRSSEPGVGGTICRAGLSTAQGKHGPEALFQGILGDSSCAYCTVLKRASGGCTTRPRSSETLPPWSACPGPGLADQGGRVSEERGRVVHPPEARLRTVQ